MKLLYTSGSRASFLPLFVLALFCFSNISVAQQKSADSLNIYISQANNLWATGESDLQLAVNLLSEVSKIGSESYYRLATDFYYWSLKNANFQEEKEVIEDELERTKPLVPDSTKTRWATLFQNNNPQLLGELAGFWEVNDSYISTKTNERLIEHWQRIHTAREKFKKAIQPPYDTDERGIYYVRLGPPQKTIRKTIQLNQVYGPEGYILDFELGNVIRSEVEVWEYPEIGDDFFLLFGERNGWGEFGVRKDLMELVQDDVRVQFGSSGFRSYHVMSDLSSKVIQYGLYKELAPYVPFIQNIFSNMQTSLSAYTLGYSPIDKWIHASFVAEPLLNVKIYENIFNAPSNKTNTVLDDGDLVVRSRIFRFISADGKNQFAVAMQPAPREEHLKNRSTLFLSNQIAVFNDNWNKVANIEEPLKMDNDKLSNPSLYLLEEPLNKYNAYFSTELIDTTYNDIFIPGKITSKASSIISTSGRKKIEFPPAIKDDNTLQISDIVLGLDQQIDENVRIPITPSIEHIYEPGTDLMVYFEAYNIPEEGYSFEYYFEKHRWLFENKRPDEKPSVTIINDKLSSDRNSQLFSISLSDLEEGTYDLIFEFSPLDQDQEQEFAKTRKIELVVSR